MICEQQHLVIVFIYIISIEKNNTMGVINVIIPWPLAEYHLPNSLYNWLVFLVFLPKYQSNPPKHGKKYQWYYHITVNTENRSYKLGILSFIWMILTTIHYVRIPLTKCCTAPLSRSTIHLVPPVQKSLDTPVYPTFHLDWESFVNCRIQILDCPSSLTRDLLSKMPIIFVSARSVVLRPKWINVF